MGRCEGLAGEKTVTGKTVAGFFVSHGKTVTLVQRLGRSAADICRDETDAAIL